jgi:hypothetical protein
MSGSGSNQDSAGRQNFGTLNPIPIALGEAFGLKGRVTPEGGLAFGSGGPGLGLSNQIFGPNTFSALGDLANPINIGAQGTPTELFNAAIPGAKDLLSTGLKTDIGPAAALSKMLFQQEFVPGLTEQFGANLGLNSNDADVQAALLREAGRRSTELGALDTQLSEAAKNRQLGALNNAPGLFNLGSIATGAERSLTPGGQLLDLFSALSSVNTQAGVAGRTDSQGQTAQFGIK